MPRALQRSALLAKAAGETHRIGKQRIAHAVDPFEQGERHAVDLGYREEGACLGLLDEGRAPREVQSFGLARTETLKRGGDALDKP
jgi:hypothetical protein